MDEIHTSSGKKQRSRNQRDRRKPQEAQVESPGPIRNNNSTDPQPQRTNRRQKNDTVTPPAKNVVQPTPSAPSEKKETTEKENVTVDFSNLKRETEEIAKLTKKFTKREITSNWHRYSAPESHENDRETEEEAPADFSALIQMPASRGGHLMLKDEQEWSSVSGEELGGYFALNLKLLCQSLACIPIYEQLRLPKHLFTEEELKNFDNKASQAKSCYNPSKMEDPNAKVLRDTYALKDSERSKNDTNPSTNSFNILDVKESSYQLVNKEFQPEIMLNNTSLQSYNFNKNDHGPSEVAEPCLNIKLKEDKNSKKPYHNNGVESETCVLERNVDENTSNFNKQKVDNILETENTNLFKEKPLSFENTKGRSPDKEISPSPQNLAINEHMENIEKPKILSENIEIRKGKFMEENSTNEVAQADMFISENMPTNEPKDKRYKSNTKIPVKDISENKTQTKVSAIKDDDDDDDLDFLLSLKTPVLPGNKKESKSVPIKESALLPKSGKPTESVSKQQNSELDDWLESLLQD